MVKISDLFNVVYGVNLEFNKMIPDDKGIPFVARGSVNNGVVGYVKQIKKIKPNPANTISVSGGGSVLECFLQEHEYYSGRDLYYLKPKLNLSKKQMLFYCIVIRSNKYRYSYGRQANKTLRDILIPSIEEIPTWVDSIKIPSPPSNKSFHSKLVSLNDRNWDWFKVSEHFIMKSGKYYPKGSYSEGSTALISSSDNNNGVMEFTNLKPRYSNCITIGKVGMSLFYHRNGIVITSDVTVLIPKFELNEFIAMFIISVLKLDQYKWNYGRQIRLNDTLKISYKLPVDKNGNPDWQFMEYYIKSLPFSSNLKSNKNQNKGLSDDELVSKYESGGINLEKAIKPMMQTPSNLAVLKKPKKK